MIKGPRHDLARGLKRGKMSTLDDELSRLDIFLNNTLDQHEARLLKSLKALEDKIVSLYARLSTDADGNLKGPKWTLAQAQELHKRLVREFAQQYEKEVDWLSSDYRSIEREVKDFTKAMGVDEAFATIDKKMLAALKKQDFNVYETLSNQTVEKIAQGVYDAISSGQSFAMLSKTIMAAITGYKDIAGRPLSQYAGTFAHDSLMKYYRNVHLTNADAAGLDHYMYYGDVIRDSRPFCAARAGRTFTKEQVDSWNGMTWQGKSGNVWSCCGGYRCRHHLVAVKKEWVGETTVGLNTSSVAAAGTKQTRAFLKSLEGQGII